MNPPLPIRLLLWAALAAGLCPAQQPRSVNVVGRVIAVGSGRPLEAAALRYQPTEDHQVTLLQGWVGAGPRQLARTDTRGGFRIPGQGVGCLLVQHEASGLGAILHRTSPNTFHTVRARPMGELVLPGGGETMAHVLAVSTSGRETHLGPWPGPRIRLPEGRYRLLVKTGGTWSESVCQVVSGRRHLLQPEVGSGTLQLYDGFDGRVTLMGWPRVALAPTAGHVPVPAGPGPRILEVWEKREGCVLLQQVWVHDRTQTLKPSSRRVRGLEVVDGDGDPVAGALCFSCYRGAGGLRVVSRSRSDDRGHAPVADVASEPTGFVLVRKAGFALGHAEVFGTEGRVKLRLQPGHALRLLVLGPRGDPQPDVEVGLRPVGMPWAARTAFTNAKGEVLVGDLALGDARLLLLGTPFLMEEHPVHITKARRPVRIQARPGHEIRGQVLLPSGRPAPNALVVVRGSLPVAEVVAPTDSDGRFVVAGLPKDTTLVLTAGLEQGGRTWTSRALHLEAGTGAVRVKLLAEDRPQPGKGNGKGRRR